MALIKKKGYIKQAIRRLRPGKNLQERGGKVIQQKSGAFREAKRYRIICFLYSMLKDVLLELQPSILAHCPGKISRRQLLYYAKVLITSDKDIKIMPPPPLLQAASTLNEWQEISSNRSRAYAKNKCESRRKQALRDYRTELASVLDPEGHLSGEKKVLMAVINHLQRKLI